MKRILLTKEIEEKSIHAILDSRYVTVSKDFIQFQFNEKEAIISMLDKKTDYYLVSSNRATTFIKEFGLEQGFFVVGEKSKEILEASDHNVLVWAETAQDLLAEIKDSIKSNKNFTFFCSNIRRDTLPEGLKNLGHTVNEIVCYETTPKVVNLNESFDSYVFFSPSGVKSFAQQYDIPKKASIFAIGKTTSEAVTNEFGLSAEYPKNANVNSLLQLIKTRLDAEK